MSFPCLLPLVAARWPDDLRLTRTQGDAAGAGVWLWGGAVSFVALSLPPVSHALPVHFRGLMVTGERGEVRVRCPEVRGSLSSHGGVAEARLPLRPRGGNNKQAFFFFSTGAQEIDKGRGGDSMGGRQPMGVGGW